MRALILFCAVVTWSASAGAVGVCFGPSSLGESGTIDCDPVNPQLWPNSFRGYSQLETPCESGSIFCGFEPRAGSNAYGWTISASSTDPYDNTGALPVPLANLYVWYACNSGDGLLAVEFGLVVDDPSLTFLSGTTLNGFLNASQQPGDFLLAVGGCPSAPMVAVNALFFNTPPVSVESKSWSGIKAIYR